MFHDLNKLNLAWSQVRAKGSAGGVDGQSVKQFAENAEKNLRELHTLLETDRYIPEPALRIYKDKGRGEKRPLGLATVTDKIVQVAVRMEIEPVFERLFLDCSYAYRPRRGHKQALERVENYLKSRHPWVTTCDIDNFFDSLDHGILLSLVKKHIKDQKIIRLIELWLKIGAVHAEKYLETSRGVPQGAVISPMLANLYLHDFDAFMRERKYDLVRYADDFIILARNRDLARAANLDAKLYLQEHRKLRLNDQKHPVFHVKDGFVFLGIYFRGFQRAIARKKMHKAKDKIKMICNRGKKKSVAATVRELNESISSWRYYYSHINTKSQFATLEQCLREGLAEMLVYRHEHKLLPSFGSARESLRNLQTLYRKSNRERSAFVHGILNRAEKIFSAEAEEKQPQGSRAERKSYGQSIASHQTVEHPGETVSTPVKQAVTRRRRRYQRRFAQTRELLITQQNATVTTQFEKIRVRGYKLDKKVSSFHLKHIVILTGTVNITSQAIRLCARHKIPIDFLDFRGMTEARLSVPESPLFNVIQHQIAAMENEKAIELAISFVEAKIKNQLNLMKYFFKYRKGKEQLDEFAKVFKIESARIEKYLSEIEAVPKENLPLLRSKLLGIEGMSASSYWNMVRKLIAERFKFDKRVHRGARDSVNAMLNYAYAFLYARVHGAIQRVGLSPHISFLHVPQGNKPTLVYDMIEEFRPFAADRVVFQLITRGEKVILEKGRLSDATRRHLSRNVLERLHVPFKHRGRETNLSDVIHDQARRLVGYLSGNKNTYRPFIGKW